MKRLVPVVVSIAIAAACSSSRSGFVGGDGDAGNDATVGTSPSFDAAFGGGDGASGEAGPADGSLFSDGEPDVRGDACVHGDAGPAPYPQRCAPAASSECAGPTDVTLTALGVGAALLNGANGNGFDDDCDGLVDEGCTCAANGTTKDCYLVPPTQANAQTKAPVGWCSANSKGSLDCAGAEFPSWSGTCRGAQPPYRHDVCAAGDFNCDGLDANSDVADCSCKVEPVTCPSVPLTVAPYPDPKNIPLVDGSLWINNPADRPNAANWIWTLVGGDCDNVLPHPTFALYSGQDSTAAGARKGTRVNVKYDPNGNPARYLAAAGEPLIAIQAANYGNGVAGSQVHPAFGLSGDYIVQGEWDLGGTHYVCTQKVQVRAPGIRAELCWDSVGGVDVPGNDLDLHLARLQGVSCGTQGWDFTCPVGSTYQDCWYDSVSGCRDSSANPPSWGYADSPDSACLGWSSLRQATGKQRCTNPRLDRDTVLCSRINDDPTIGGPNAFCGPENINLDNPKDGDRFAVAVNHYGGAVGGSPNAHPHVNLYCNGERVLSLGYNPLTNQTSFPLLDKNGKETSGDWWTAAGITTHVDAQGTITCTVFSVPSHHADPTRDGPPANPSPNDTTGLCVDATVKPGDTLPGNQTPPPYQYDYVNHAFIDRPSLQNGAAGTVPINPADWCKH
jgi:hypothetical protein